MALPTVPLWDSSGTHGTEPVTEKTSGWGVAQAPSAQVFNWFMHAVSVCLAYLATVVTAFEAFLTTAHTWTATQTFGTAAATTVTASGSISAATTITAGTNIVSTGGQFLGNEMILGFSATVAELRVTPRIAPLLAAAGSVWYDSGTNKLKVHNGTTWVDLH